MNDTIIVGLLSLIGTIAGTFGGILTSNKMTTYRIEQLEKKVQAHNNLVERMYHIEDIANIHDEKIKVANHRIDDLESHCKPS